MGVVLVGLELIKCRAVPATDLVERGVQVRADTVCHDLPSVLRGQHDVCMKFVDHMPTVAPVIHAGSIDDWRNGRHEVYKLHAYRCASHPCGQHSNPLWLMSDHSATVLV